MGDCEGEERNEAGERRESVESRLIWLGGVVEPEASEGGYDS